MSIELKQSPKPHRAIKEVKEEAVNKRIIDELLDFMAEWTSLFTVVREDFGEYIQKEMTEYITIEINGEDMDKKTMEQTPYHPMKLKDKISTLVTIKQDRIENDGVGFLAQGYVLTKENKEALMTIFRDQILHNAKVNWNNDGKQPPFDSLVEKKPLRKFLEGVGESQRARLSKKETNKIQIRF